MTDDTRKPDFAPGGTIGPPTHRGEIRQNSIGEWFYRETPGGPWKRVWPHEVLDEEAIAEHRAGETMSTENFARELDVWESHMSRMIMAFTPEGQVFGPRNTLIYLNGVKQDRVVYADSDEGRIRQIATTPDGNVIYNNGEPAIDERHGSVEFRSKA